MKGLMVQIVQKEKMGLIFKFLEDSEGIVYTRIEGNEILTKSCRGQRYQNGVTEAM